MPSCGTNSPSEASPTPSRSIRRAPPRTTRGSRPDPRTQAVLRDHGVRPVGRARQVRAEDWTRFDHILAMDRSNLRRLDDRRPASATAALALALEPVGGGEVPDPYYGGDDGFERVYGMLDEALDAWIERWT